LRHEHLWLSGDGEALQRLQIHNAGRGGSGRWCARRGHLAGSRLRGGGSRDALLSEGRIQTEDDWRKGGERAD